MSNVGDNERLMVLVEARITDLERNMKKASATTGREFGNMRRQSGSATHDMERDIQRTATRINQATTSIGGSIGSMSRAFAGGLVGGVAAMGVGGVISSMRQIADSVAEVGDQATMAGLSFRAFQEWKYVAEQARIPVDAITDGLKELQLRADEFAVTGQGSAAEAFRRLGMTPVEVKQRLENPSELLLLLIERTRQLGDTAAGVRIFDELFGGTGGERMVSLINQGEVGIRRQIEAANDFGRVLDDDVILKAQEIDRQFNAIAQTVGTTLKSALVSVVASLSDFIDGWRTIENQRRVTLDTRMADLGRERLDIENNLLRQPRNARGDTRRQRLAAILEEEEQILSELSRRGPEFKPSANEPWQAPAYTPPVDPAARKTANTAEREAERNAKAAEREAEAVRKFIEELEEEQRLVSATDVERQISNALRHAGAAATDEQKAKIRELVTAIEEETIATEGLKAAQEEMADVGREAFRTILDGFKNGASAAEIMTDVVGRLSDRLIDMSLDGLFSTPGRGGAGGSFLGALGSLFGGFREHGGPVSPGKAYVVGEKRPELFVPDRPGAILPTVPTGGGQGQVIDIRLTDDTGRMAQIAKQEIKTASGDIIRVSVTQARDIASRDFTANYQEAITRGGIR